jgi:uncharacterized repeat protein (TIGR03803 family)
MSLQKRLGFPCATMLVVTGIILVLSRGVWAQSKYKTLHTFKGSGGVSPYGGLTFDSAGNLYGTTTSGGLYSYGTVFELTPNVDGKWKESVLHSFDDTDGQQPVGTLIFDSAGNLYGTTWIGGTYGWGTVFELMQNADGSWKESVLHSFNSTDGQNPLAGVIFDSAGNLYGTTGYGGPDSYGTVFELTPNADGSWKETILHSFASKRGLIPFGGLIFDSAGNLYSTTYGGGAYNNGTVFELTPNADGSWKEIVLHSFNGIHGQSPNAGLIFDSAGNLYGTTSYGGTYNNGTAFTLRQNKNGNWKASVLHSFNSTNGDRPVASLIFDSAGNLYGTTVYGGAHNYGTVFKLKPNAKGGWTESVLHTFRDRPGALPYDGLTLDGQGNIYGTTFGDGTTTLGSIFEISP